jgi:hypothetical protein
LVKMLFTWLSTREWIVVGAAPQQVRDDLRIDGGAAVCDSANRLQKVVELEHPVLEQVAEALGCVPDGDA